MIDPRPENAPVEVQEREARKKALMMSSDHDDLPPEDDMTEEEKDAVNNPIPDTASMMAKIPVPVQMPSDPLTAFATLLKDYGEHKEVRVNTPIGHIVLRALHVCINQTSIGMILKKDDMHIEPTFGSELEIEVDGRPMNVIYGGGLFTFKKIPVTFLSFFRVSEDSDSTGEEDPL